MERVLFSGIELTWTSSARIAQWRFIDDRTQGTEVEARYIIERIQGWTRGLDQRYALLIDCTRVVNVNAGWRSLFSDWFRSEADNLYVAWFNASAVVQIVIRMFITATSWKTSFKGKAFREEAEALRWFSSLGIPADVYEPLPPLQGVR